jgi:hypothetical protein
MKYIRRNLIVTTSVNHKLGLIATYDFRIEHQATN